MEELTLFQNFFNTASHLQLPLAIWRLPKETVIRGIVDLTEHSSKTWEFEQSSGSSGYVVQGFDNTDQSNKLFIRASVLCNATDIIKLNDAQQHLIKPELWKKFQDHFNDRTFQKENLSFHEEIISFENSADYKKIVGLAIEAIANNEFKKVVLGRQKIIALSDPISIVKIYFDLVKAYPTAFVSIIYHPSKGCWVGASPELLLSINSANIFKTVALAGTQKINTNTPLSEIVWTHKEIEEQALVARYIINCFKTIRLRDYEDIGPRTVIAGQLAHLQTDFEVNMIDTGYPDLANLMLNLLHPTSAICGMPKLEALNFINTHENIDRSLFSGYCGPINFESQSNLFVNIRCSRVYSNAVTLYAGAGITQESNPQKELDETNAKMETIGRFFEG